MFLKLYAKFCSLEAKYNRDLLAGTKFHTIKIFCAKTTEKKQENREIRQFPTKKGNEIRASLPQVGNNPDHGHEVKLLI